jgi:hypothetical protein
MIGFKELAFVNETIKCLGYKAMNYIKQIHMYTIIEFLVKLYTLLAKLGLEILLQILMQLKNLIKNYLQL